MLYFTLVLGICTPPNVTTHHDRVPLTTGSVPSTPPSPTSGARVSRKTMLSTSRVSRSSLKRVRRLQFNLTRAVPVFHAAEVPCQYSTTTTTSTSDSSLSTSESTITPLSALPPLPEESEWRQIFYPHGASVGLRERVSIRNPQSASALAEAFTRWTKPLLKVDEVTGKGKTAKGAPKIIIEAFPGTPQSCAPCPMS